jgi:enterochelin esterase family protein
VIKEHLMKASLWVTFAMGLVLVIAGHAAAEGGEGLSSILLADEGWEVAVEGLGFADGLTCDEEGNLYFSDLRAKPAAIYRLSGEGAKTKVAEASRSGLEMGGDGRLYGCGGGKIVFHDVGTGKETVLAEGVQPNDLAVSSKGFIYFTETGKRQVTMVDAKTREVKAVDVGISRPNGIALSPDEGTLYVSDYGGIHVYSFRVEADGRLGDKRALMTMKAPENRPEVAGGDGMTTDTAGRAWVTTALGLQIFDKEGNLLGVLPKPQDGALVSVAFGGEEFDTLYVACGDKVYRRKVRAKGR